MKRIFFPLLAVLVFLSGCGGDKKKAFDFNQRLVKISEGLQEKGNGIGRELEQAMNTKNFSSVADSSQSLLDFINKNLNELKKMKNVKGSENLKSAMIDFLNFEKEMVSEAYIPLGKIDVNTGDTEIQTALNNMLEKSRQESDYLMKVQSAQREYASKNGFKIEN